MEVSCSWYKQYNSSRRYERGRRSFGRTESGISDALRSERGDRKSRGQRCDVCWTDGKLFRLLRKTRHNRLRKIFLRCWSYAERRYRNLEKDSIQSERGDVPAYQYERGRPCRKTCRRAEKRGHGLWSYRIRGSTRDKSNDKCGAFAFNSQIAHSVPESETLQENHCGYRQCFRRSWRLCRFDKSILCYPRYRNWNSE